MHCSRQVCSHLLYILVVDLMILVSPLFLKRLQWGRASHTVHRWSSSRIASSLVQSDGSGTVQLVRHIAVCTIAIIGNHRRRQIVTGRKLERLLRWRPQKQTQAQHCHHHRWNSYLSQLEGNIALSFGVHFYQSAYLIQMSVCLTACFTVTYFTRTPLALAFRGEFRQSAHHIVTHLNTSPHRRCHTDLLLSSIITQQSTVGIVNFGKFVTRERHGAVVPQHYVKLKGHCAVALKDRAGRQSHSLVAFTAPLCTEAATN